jgi:hypothetical protein
MVFLKSNDNFYSLKEFIPTHFGLLFAFATEKPQNKRKKGMDYIKKFFLQDESGTAEAVSSAVLMAIASGLSGIWNGGFYGIWDSLFNNPSALILVVFTLVFVWWVIFKA